MTDKDKATYVAEIIKMVDAVANVFSVTVRENVGVTWASIFLLHEYIPLKDILQAGSYLMATETESYGRLPLPGKILDIIREGKAASYFKAVDVKNRSNLIATKGKELHYVNQPRQIGQPAK